MIALRRYGLAAILALAALLAVGQVNQHLILASDNASYIVLGQALALGRGYRMINEPLAPAMNLYPVAYPALLAVVLRLAGAVTAPLQAVVPLKLVAVFFYLATLPVLYMLVRRRHGDLPAGLVTLLTAACPDVLTLGTEILSDVPFLFLALLGLLLVEMYAGGAPLKPQMNTDEHGWTLSVSIRVQSLPRPIGHLWFPTAALLGAELAMAGAYYMRTAGLALLAAVPLYLLLKRKMRAGIGLALFLGLLALPWLLRSSATPSAETPFFARSYIHQVLALAPYSEEKVSLLGLAGRIVSNSLAYGVDILPEALFPHIARLGGLAGWAQAAIAILLVLGFVLEVRRGVRAGEVAVAAYWLSLSLFVWVLGFRYVLFVIPFAFLYLLIAVQWLGQRVAVLLVPADESQGRPNMLKHVTLWKRALLPRNVLEHVSDTGPRVGRGLTIVVAGVLLLSALVVDARRVERNLQVTRRQTLAQVYEGNGEWRWWLDTVARLQQATPPDAVVMARKPDLLYLLSGRATVEYPYTKDTAALMSTLRANGVTYILEDGFTWTRTTEIYLAPAMSGRPEAFTLVCESPAPRTRVWRVTE